MVPGAEVAAAAAPGLSVERGKKEEEAARRKEVVFCRSKSPVINLMAGFLFLIQTTTRYGYNINSMVCT